MADKEKRNNNKRKRMSDSPERIPKKRESIHAKFVQQELDLEKDKNKVLEEMVKDLNAKLCYMKETSMQQKVDLENKLDDLKLEYYQTEINCMSFKAKWLKDLAERRSPVLIVERPVTNTCEKETLQDLHNQVVELQAENSALKLGIKNLPRAILSTVADTSAKIQEACNEHALYHSKRLEREIAKRKVLHDTLVELRGNIRVFLRPKPLSSCEGGVEPVFQFDQYDDTTVTVPSKGRKFEFEKVFSSLASQEEVFSEVSALVQSVIDGHNVCIFAYGQTGSGKTHTMEGSFEDPGVNQRALKFLYKETQNSPDFTYSLEASLVEIYNETIRDLLNCDPHNKLEVKMKPDGGLHVPGLTSVPVDSLEEINRISKIAQQNRATASTSMNEHSSRSHCVLCVKVEETNLKTGVRTTGRLNLVDLAGSERVSKSQVEGARLKEAQSINKSLSSLGDVINSLKNKQTHIPYRNSKLTYLLQESLGGDSKTLMILQASSHPDNLHETLSTLTFGQRVRSVMLNSSSKNTPSSSRWPQNDTPTGQGSATRKFHSSVEASGGSSASRTPTSALVKASSVPCRLNVKMK